MKQYRCPYCDFKGDTEKLIDHINDEHEEMIPEKYTATRLVYNIRNKKDHGTCLMCKKPTEWNEDKARYYSLCNDKKCHDEYVKRFEKNMIKVYDKPRLLDDMDQQEKMLANRKISGEYTFEDGGKHTYTGSFEHKALEFLDKVLHVKSKELMVPGPVLEYKDSKGKLRKYIPDIYWIDLNLLIEVKDGGNNPNTRNMPEYRDKQAAKEKMVTDKGDFNYLRLTNNNFEQLFSIIAEIKQNNLEGKTNRVIRINENYTLEVGPIGGMVPANAMDGYIIYHGFNGIDPTNDDENANTTQSISSNTKCAITNDLSSDKALELDDNNELKPVPLRDILKNEVKVYKYLGPRSKFIKTCKKVKLEHSIYEELSGHKQYSKDQINYDPLFERFSYAKLKNRTNEYLATLQEEYNTLVGIPNTSLPIINPKMAELAKKKLVPYPSLDIKEDMNGFYAYNKYTKVRTQSYKNLDDLKLEDTNLEDKEAEKWEKESNKPLIGNDYDPEDIELSKQKYDSLPRKQQREADWESFKIYYMTNPEIYSHKKSAQLKKDLDRQIVSNYDGMEPMCESDEYNFDLVKYGNKEIELAKDWAITSNIHIIIPKNDLDDLEYDWIQFKSQIRPLQRKSDWKSLELFGMNNETHYNYLKNKLVRKDDDKNNISHYDGVAKSTNTERQKLVLAEPSDVNITNLAQPVTPKVESAAEIMLCERTNKIAKLMKVHNLPILFSDDDIIYNATAFRDKKVNVVLITGMSGGGKTTLASKICKFSGAKLIELDLFSHWGEYKEDPEAFDISLIGDAFPKVLDDYFKKTYSTVDEYKRKIGLIDKSSKRYYAEMLKMIEYFIKISNPSNRYVIEGVQIPIVTLLNTSILDKTTTILVSTSVVRSFFYRMKRDGLKLSEIKTLLVKYYNWYESQNNHRGLLTGYYMNNLNSADDTSTLGHLYVSSSKSGSSHSLTDLEESEVLYSKFHTNNLMQNTFEPSMDDASDLPCFTPNEMDFYGINTGEIGAAFAEEWNKVFHTKKLTDQFINENKKRIQKLGMAITDEEKLKLGWNPAIPFTPQNRAKMDLRMKKKIDHVIVNEIKEFPVKVGDDYSIYIKRNKKISFEKAYQECHSLLIEYEKADNIEGIKYEIIKMAWIRASVENALDDLKSQNKLLSSDARKLVNLRGRCINDFKKYMKIILAHDNNYNFTKQYEASPFSDKVYKIDGSLVKFVKPIKDLFV